MDVSSSAAFTLNVSSTFSTNDIILRGTLVLETF